MRQTIVSELGRYYVWAGSRIVFMNGMTLNQLALEMWDRLGGQGVAAFGRFSRLAVENGRAGLRLAAGFLPHPWDHGRVYLLPSASLAPPPKVAIHRLPRRQIMRQGTPATAITLHAQDPVQNPAPRMDPRVSTRPFGLRASQVLLNQAPLVIVQIARVGLLGFGHPAILPEFLCPRKASFKTGC
jgi:hypothetical protein